MKTHQFGGGWGYHISWFNYEERKAYGHMPFEEAPKVGDEIVSKMSSGRHFRFRVTSMEWMRDPPDMFFVDLEDVGYEDEK
jgi:hypothetical protein